MSLNDRISELSAWIIRMNITEEQRSLAHAYLQDLRELVEEEGLTNHTKHAVSHAAMMLGLWSRPVAISMCDVMTLMDNHKRTCMKEIDTRLASSSPAGMLGVALASVKAVGMPAAIVTVAVLVSESGLLRALAAMLGGQ